MLGATALADSAIEVVPLPTLSVRTSVALLLPPLVALNVTLMMAEDCGAMMSGEVKGSTENSAALVPVIATLVISRFALPVLLTVTGNIIGVPAGWLPKLGDEARLMTGSAPVPVRLTT